MGSLCCIILLDMIFHDSETDFAAFSAAQQEAASFFSSDLPVFVARAPGRLDVMGGIADYSGSLVAEMPIAQAAVAGVQCDESDGSVRVRSANAISEGFTPEITLPAELFTNPVSLLRWVKENGKASRWAGYVAGCIAILRAEGFLRKSQGARILLRSAVPLGAGVSSSAAIETATMRALCAAYDIALDGLTMARYCQRVENEIVDAPCGIMDQVTCLLGEAGKLQLLLCQPYQVEGTVGLPHGWTVFGIDSGVKHSVAGTAYTKVRIAAFMGYKILADRAGDGFGGYLCNVSPDKYHALLPERLPESLQGAVFLGIHGGIFDTITRVDASETYKVRSCAEHAIHENQRVHRFVEYLADGSEMAMQKAGQLMNAAHDSYNACDLGSSATDRLAAIARTQTGVVGAKITGGGSGGTVCVLCCTNDEAAIVEAVTTAYTQETGIPTRVIQGTSPGALATPVRMLRL